MIEQLQKVEVFKYCKRELLGKISENLIFKDEAPGTTILSHGDDSKHVYIIFEGSAMIVQLAEDGKVVGLELVKSRGCFGEMSARWSLDSMYSTRYEVGRRLPSSSLGWKRSCSHMMLIPWDR